MQDIPKSVPVRKIIKETENVKTFIFDAVCKPDGGLLDAQPGQFVNLWLPGINEKPMSVAYCDEKEFWVTIFAVGEFSKAMHELKEGDLVGVRGPYGRGFRWQKGQRLVMMAGGYGAAPLYYLTQRAVADGCKVDFVIGARSKDHLLYIDRIKKLGEDLHVAAGGAGAVATDSALGAGSVELQIATDDGSEGVKGYNVVILDKLIEEAKAGTAMKVICDGNMCRREEVTVSPIDCVYACGPELMMKAVSDKCFDAGVNAQLSVERYMKCGFGVCGQCSVDDSGIRMCKEGPCLDNEQVRKIKEFGKYHRDSLGKMHEF